MGAHAGAVVQEHEAVEAAAPFAASRHRFEQLVGTMGSAKALGMTHRELEDLLTAEGREVLRHLYQDHLTLRGPGRVAVGVVDREGVAHTHVREQGRDLETVFGTVRVERVGYGGPGLDSLHPLDAELNLPDERYSHGVRRRVAEEAARGSFDDAVEAVARTTGARLPKRQAETLVARAAADFEDFYLGREAATRREVRATGEVLVLTTDGKGVVMRPSALRPATQRAAAKQTRKLKRRLSKGEKRCRKRMAQVAAVYTVAPFVRRPEDLLSELRGDGEPVVRPRPENKRVWASVDQTADEVIAHLFAEALRRDPAFKKRWVSVVDGNLSQLDSLLDHAERQGAELTVIIDIVHVLEYVWKAALAFHAEGTPEAERWVGERFVEILRGRASLVAAGMRRSATLRELTGAKRAAVDTCADYLLSYSPYLRYDQYLAAGLPIASGVIEGACRHLVADRMDITGARWSVPGAEAVLRLRALRSSGDLDEYWRFHEAQEHLLNYEMAYAGAVPAVVRPRRPLAARSAADSARPSERSRRAHLTLVP
jgi:hypothetical protein